MYRPKFSAPALLIIPYIHMPKHNTKPRIDAKSTLYHLFALICKNILSIRFYKIFDLLSTFFYNYFPSGCK